MKQGTAIHPKTKRLARLLGVPRPHAVGILCMLWDSTDRLCPKGDIGHLDNEDIADEVCWEGDPETLIQALIDSRWLDKNDEHRLIVHDWPDHANPWVHRKVARMEGVFADGAAVKVGYLTKEERHSFLQEHPELVAAQEDGKRIYAENTPNIRRKHGEHTPNVRRKHGVCSTKSSQSNPIQSNPIQVTPIQANPIQAEPIPRATEQSASAEELANSKTGPEESAEGLARLNATFGRLSQHVEERDRKHSKPEPVGSLVDDAVDAIAASGPETGAVVKRALGLCADLDRSLWRQWFELVTPPLLGPDLDAVLRYVADCQDPTVRSAKGLGALKQPGRYLVSQVTGLCKQRGLRWPAFPEDSGSSANATVA